MKLTKKDFDIAKKFANNIPENLIYMISDKSLTNKDIIKEIDYRTDIGIFFTELHKRYLIVKKNAMLIREG